MPDTSTEVAIATQTLGSAASTITFSSIPSTYTDLRLVLKGTLTSFGPHRLQFNSSGGTAYSETYLAGDGSASSSGRTTSTNIIELFNVAYAGSNPFMVTADIFSYASSNYKTTLITTTNDQNGSGSVERIVGLWRSTSAITAVSILGQTMAIGTTATLYGIL